IWMPANYMLIDILKKLASACKEKIHIEVAGEKPVDIEEMAASFAQRLLLLFKKNAKGYRPCLGEEFPFQQGENGANFLLFYEYFNPETGKGLGASHQTGWTALIANLIDEFR
ncbi:MAG: glucosidase, partial [Chlamydiales bacterium]|nr:glucosidase [Chlamydiales bacterium]